MKRIPQTGTAFARFGPREEEREAKVDVSPLIDMVFILLIFFVVAATFLELKGLGIETSYNPDPSTELEKPLVLSVAKDGTYRIEGRGISADGLTEAVVAEMMSRPRVAIVEVSQGASAGAMVRAFDALGGAGAESVTTRVVPD